jgi:hypothetical protein
LRSALPTTQFTSQPNNNTEGREVLDNFVGKKGGQVLKNSYSTVVDIWTDSSVTIAGYNESTKIAPLLQAFETINLNVTLPGLKTDLLSSAALTGESFREVQRR